MLYVRNNGGAWQIYYIYRDYQGSITHITNSSGTLVQELSYDAWGRLRNPDTQVAYFPSPQGEGAGGEVELFLGRGYTGHEHLTWFGLINMNARLYDPALGRFLSPDPYVQAPDFTQNFNRYSYCLNNPLKYVDQDGEWIHLLIGGLIGGVINWATHGAEFSWKGLGYFGVGALAGVLSAGIGAGVNVAMAGGSFGAGFMGTAAGVASTGFIAGTATGASAGLINGFVSGTGNNLLGGQNIGKSLLGGLDQGWKQGLAGGITGGIFGGIDAMTKKVDFFTGKANFDLSTGFGATGIANTNQTVTGKYVGKYEGVNVYESPTLGSANSGSGGITLPGRGIVVGDHAFTSKMYPKLMQHEFGHILQAREVGLHAYYSVIAKESAVSAAMDGIAGHSHNLFWTETWANYLSSQYFGSTYIQSIAYPIQNISTFNYVRLLLSYIP